VSDALGELVGKLRTAGSRIGIGELLSAHHAVAAVELEDLRLALRAVLCSSRADLEPFDEAFEQVFGAGRLVQSPPSELGMIERAALPRAGIPSAPPSLVPELPYPVPAAWSAIELLREKDFALYSDAETAAARTLIHWLARRGPTRMSRRLRPTRRRGHSPDLRRTVQASMRTGGELVERHWRAPTERPRPLVLVCDVSGSMAPYARMLLMYMQACVAARRRVEAFAFGTRLTRITHELSGRDQDLSLQRATEAVVDFAGGTRIGDAIGSLNRSHGRRIGRGAVVVILSDGWDRGDPSVLAAELARLRRTAFRLVWLNPLAADPRFEPLTRGMRAAVPHTDELLAGNSLASLETLAEILEGI
jgi:uncharacterized protein with von Willebrand factor type A (vWA) domain